MTDKKKSRGPGRPPGAINKKRVPKSDALLKLSKQGMEMGMNHLINILTNPDRTQKDKDMAAKVLADLGKAFVMADLKENFSDKPKGKDGEEEPSEVNNTSAPKKEPESNVFSLKTYTEDK